MTKLQYMLTSLIAVIPGAFLIYLLVMAMLSHSENLSTMAYVVMGGTLLSMVVTVLIPAGILVGGRRKPASAKSASPAVELEDASGDIEALDEEVEVFDEESEPSYGDDLEIGQSEFDLGSSEMDLQEFGEEGEIDTEPVEEFEGFDIDEGDMEDEVEEIEEEPKPKKKKR